MTRVAGLCVVVLASGVASADSSVAKPAVAEPGWCLARYLKETRRQLKAAGTAGTVKAATFKLGSVGVRLELPPALTAAVLPGELIQLGAGVPSTADAFTGWEATLQLRWQTRAELETRIKAIVSDFMGTTRADIEARPATLQGMPAEELCALVRRTPGHATMIDGTHRAMPEIVELVHGYLFAVAGKTLTAVYRLPPQAVEQQPMWERVLESLRVDR